MEARVSKLKRLTKAQLIEEILRLQTIVQAEAEPHHDSFLALTNHVVQGVFIHEDWNLLYVNKSFAEILGFESAQDILDLGDFRRLIADHEFDRLNAIHDARRRGERVPDVFDFQGVRMDGSFIWLQMYSQLIDWQGRQVIHGSVINIDGRKTMESEIHEQLTMLQKLIDAIPAPIFYKDTDHIYQGCNSAFEAFIGKTRAEVLGSSVYDVAPKDLADVYRDADEKLFSQRGTQVYEAAVQFADGSHHDVIFHKAVFEKQDGSVAGLVGAMLDITERKRAERALQESRNLFEHLVENAPDPIFVHDMTGQLLQVNENACRSLGYSRDELMAMNVTNFEIGAPPEILKELWSTLSTGVKHAQGKHQRKDGSTFPVEVHVSRLDTDTGLPSGFIAVVRNVTERMEAETRLTKAKQEAEDANRAKSEFLANMSHELRTPLNAILGFSEIIKREVLGPIGTPAYCDYANDIHGSGIHLLQIINDMLDISRLHIGAVNLDDKPTDVRELADACVRMLGNSAEEEGLTLAVSIPDDVPHLVCDSRRVVQILVNLVGNSIKFTPTGGSIWIAAEMARNGGVRLLVRDTGIGISADNVPKVQIPFEQLESPLTRRYMGAGLGLALSTSLAELHGADLTIDSAVDEGTTVFVQFPPERSAH